MAKVVAVIPARFASSRFPGKPLVSIAGKPMVQWVYERVSKAKLPDQVLVATDDQRILDAVRNFGGKAVMTPADIACGTDRVAHVVEKIETDIVVNIQGDEPLIEPDAVDLVVQTLQSDDKASMATLARRINDPEELNNFDTTRVVIDTNNRALYFSRAVIPYARDFKNKQEWAGHFPYYDQIGIYAYRRLFLLNYKNLPYSILEEAEKLEQLRALENGYIIKIGLCDFQLISVDVPAHVGLVEQKMRELGYLD